MAGMNLNGIRIRGLVALVFFVIALLQVPFCHAQRYEFGMGGGPMLYRGDLNPKMNLLTARPAVQAFARYNFSMTAVGRFNVAFGQLTGDGSLSPSVYTSVVKPLTFSTPVVEISGFAEYNFFNYRNPKNRFIFGSPYLFGGPAVFIFSPSPVELGGRVSSVQPAFVMGFGYKHQVGQYWNVGLEFGGRLTFTDYLDNVSDKEINTGMQTGNLYDKDVYTYFSLNISYTLKEIICPFDYQQFDDQRK